MSDFISNLKKIAHDDLPEIPMRDVRDYRDQLIEKMFFKLKLADKFRLACVLERWHLARLVEAKYPGRYNEYDMAIFVDKTVSTIRAREELSGKIRINPFSANTEYDDAPTITDKLLMLTNGDIIATAGDKAFDRRMTLVCQVFPKLSADEQRAIFEKSEFDDVMRELKSAFNGLGDKGREKIARDVIGKMKVVRLKSEMLTATKRLPYSPPADDAGGWEPH